MSRNGEEAVVELIIPARPEYVSVARLAILGVASRMPFSYDEVEDVRVVLGYRAAEVARVVFAVRPDATVVLNHEFASTGTAASFLRGAAGSTGPFPPSSANPFQKRTRP